MTATIISFVLTIAEYFLRRSLDNKAARELFYQFVDRIQKNYMQVVELRDEAKKQLEDLAKKPFVEAP